MTRRLFAAFFAVAVACVDQGEKPPPPTCLGCVGARPGSVDHVPPGGSAGAGGASNTGDEPVRLVGDVVLLSDIAGQRAIDFVESAELRAEGENGDVRGRWNGNDPFSIEGVRRSGSVWVEVTPLAGDALLTLQPVSTLQPDAAGIVETGLTVVSASEIELALGAISSPLAPDSQRAQVVLVATENEVPVEGVRVTAAGAEAVIYVQNGAYTDADTVTDSSGVVVLANVPVPSNGSYTVRFEGEVAGSAGLRLVPGGVTYGAIGN